MQGPSPLAFGPDDTGPPAAPTSDDPYNAAGHDLLTPLKLHFGHNSFRPMQQKIIRDALARRDAFVLMPTGGGKSLCYQLPALLLPGVAIVVSPLIALMQDQVTALDACGISATVLNSSVAPDQIARREQDAAAGRFNLIYLAPERLMGPTGQRLIGQLTIAFFAIDEAHCISEWGHDFRPEYRMLGRLRRQFANVPIMALTATATPRVADDIVVQLHLQRPAIYRGHFERTNLYYEVRPKQRVFEQVLRYLTDNPTAEGIIYCQSRASTESLSQRLRAKGISAVPYHAGLDKQVRADNQHGFVYGNARVVVATIAFGMGIDKPDVRFVIHADLPKNLESYYQETGRAGRDGLRSDCILFFSAGDRIKIERFIEEKPDERERQMAYDQLQQMVEYAYATSCRTRHVLEYFGQECEGECGHCDNCLLPPSVVDATEDAQKLLSAIARTGQRFGITHVLNVLRGADNERVTQYRHDQLSVYGIGSDQPIPYWRRLADHLIRDGRIGVTNDDYRTLHLTETSMQVLRGQEKVNVVQPRAAKVRKEAAKKVKTIEADGRPMDDALFEALRALRKRIAVQQGVPPYVIFNDTALRQMAQRYPTTDNAFLDITGVGQVKLERYGDIVMKEIAAFAPANQAEE